MSEASAQQVSSAQAVLITAPWLGSVWLSAPFTEAEHGWWVGQGWDDSSVGSPYYPDDFRGKPYSMGFTLAMVRKVERSGA